MTIPAFLFEGCCYGCTSPKQKVIHPNNSRAYIGGHVSGNVPFGGDDDSSDEDVWWFSSFFVHDTSLSFLLLFFYYSCYLYGAGGSFCGQTKVFFQGMNIDCDNMYTISWVPFWILFVYVFSLGAVKRRWQRIKSGGAHCITSVADICRVKVHFLWVLFSVFIPPFTCVRVIFVYLSLKVSIELYDIYCKGEEVCSVTIRILLLYY